MGDEEGKEEIDPFELFADLNDKDNTIKELMEKSKIIDEYGVNLYEIKSMFNDVEKAINEVLFDLEDKLDQIYGDKNIKRSKRKRSKKSSKKKNK